MLLPILGAAVILWLWGKLRADIVGIAALFTLAVLGFIPAPDVFSGFSHPAVITLAAMMVLGYALHHCGALDMLSRLLSALGHDPLVFVLLLSFYTVVLTSFLGYHIALVIILPFAVQLSGKRGVPSLAGADATCLCFHFGRLHHPLGFPVQYLRLIL